MMLHSGNRGKMFTAMLLLSFIFLNNNSISQDSAVVTPETDSLVVATDSVKPVITGKKKIYTFELTQDIFPAAWRLVNRAVEEAEKQNADYIIMRLNTYGGMVDMADSISNKLLKAKPTTVVFIDPNAASAGALISISCDSIYMSPAGRIGAATVVSSADGQQVPDKYQSYMRATMRSIAKSQGRDTLIAEAMVDTGSVTIGVIKAGKTLTLTTSEAIANGYCEGRVNSIEEVIKMLGIADYEVIQHKESTLDKMISALMNPVLSGILMLVIIGGIYFELQTPGVGFPLVAAVIAAVLYFAPLYLEGLAENWEILIFLGGIGLLAVEIFVLPGFGVAGIAGISLMVIGLTLALIRNVKFDFTFAGGDEIAGAIFRVVITLLAAVVFFLLFSDKLLFRGPFRRLILADTQNRTEGYTSQTDSSKSLIGKTGIAINDLRPAGTVEIDNERYDVISDGEHIPKNSTVKVVKVQGNYYVVAKV